MLPSVKNYTKGGATIKAPAKTTYSFSDSVSGAAANIFKLLCPEANKSDTKAFVKFEYASDICEKPEAYEIKIDDSGITAFVKDKRSGANAAATVAQLIRKGEIAIGTITDHPDAKCRAFMVDMARGLPDLDTLKHYILTMALTKYNMLHLHLMDSEGLCFKSEAMPKLNGKGGVQCTKDDLREIVALCNTLCIDVLPEIEIPSHATSLINAYPHLACDTDGTSKWVLCPAADGLFEHFDALVEEVCDIFPYEYIHVGGDELDFPGMPHHNMVCYWDKCPRCSALRKKLGLDSVREEYYYVMNKVYDLVKAHGKKIIMWNDQIDISKEVPLSRDILIDFWRIAPEARGPMEGCSMVEFLNKGFTLVNAYFPYTYICNEDYLNLERLSSWTPLTEPEVPFEHTSMVIGGKMCAWELGNKENYPFYPYITDLSLALFSDKLWTYGTVAYTKEYKDMLSEFLFGYIPENDIFAPIGSILPPRSKTEYTYLKSAPAYDDIKRSIDELEAKKNGYNSFVSDAFIGLLGKIAKE